MITTKHCGYPSHRPERVLSDLEKWGQYGEWNYAEGWDKNKVIGGSHPGERIKTDFLDPIKLFEPIAEPVISTFGKGSKNNNFKYSNMNMSSLLVNPYKILGPSCTLPKILPQIHSAYRRMALQYRLDCFTVVPSDNTLYQANCWFSTISASYKVLYNPKKR